MLQKNTAAVMTLYAITPRDRTTAHADPVTLAMDVTAQVTYSSIYYFYDFSLQLANFTKFAKKVSSSTISRQCVARFTNFCV